MTYRGRIQKGVVIFDGPVSLDDGTLVNVEPMLPDAAALVRGSPEAVRHCKARWAGDPAELDELLSEVQRMRDADLTSVDDS